MPLRRSIRNELAATQDDTSSAVLRPTTHRAASAAAQRDGLEARQVVRRTILNRIRNRRAATATRNATSSAVQRPAERLAYHRAARAATATRNATSSAAQRPATHRAARAATATRNATTNAVRPATHRAARATTATRNATSSAVQRPATDRIRNRRAATATRNATSNAVIPATHRAARAATATRNAPSNAVQRPATHRAARAATATRNATSSAAQRPATHAAVSTAVQRFHLQAQEMYFRMNANDTELQNFAIVPQYPVPVYRPQNLERFPPPQSRGGGANGRLGRELNEIMLNPTDGCQVEIVGDDITHWNCIILGPSNSPYEGGHFELDILFPDNYPYAAPHVQFMTPIYHCNISRGGHIVCLDILSHNWSSILTVDKVLLSIMSLIADPNPDDPVNVVAANMYKSDREQHDRIAREWTTLHALPLILI